MEKDDFTNPIDWVIYKVNGRKPQKKNDELTLVKHSLPTDERKYGLKFYRNKSDGRYGVFYQGTHLCACNKDQIKEIQSYFDKRYNGKNIKKIQDNLKSKYNIKRRAQTYKKGRLNFQHKGNERLTARVNHKGKAHTICSCYKTQRKEVSDKYDELKKTHDLDTIKKIMKEQYNLKQKGRKRTKIIKHQINITQDGACYKDGKLYTIDPNVYNIVEAYIEKIESERL